jgi:large subunit ribosomal protein L40e
MDDPVSKRLFDRVFICMKCHARLRANPEKVKAEKVKCRKCGYKGLRPKKRMRKGKAK